MLHLRFTPGPVLHLLHQAVDLAGKLVGALEGEFYFFVSFSSNSGQFPPTNTLCGIRSGYFVQVIVPTALFLHLLHCLHAFFGMKLSNAIFCVLLHVDNRLSLCVLCHSFNNEVAPTREHNLALEIVPDTGHISPGLAGDDLRNGQLTLHGVAVLCCGAGCIRFIRHNIALCVFRQKRVQRLLPLHVKGQPTIDCPFMYRQLLQGAVQIVHHLLLRLGKALAVPQLGVDLVAIATLVLQKRGSLVFVHALQREFRFDHCSTVGLALQAGRLPGRRSQGLLQPPLGLPGQALVFAGQPVGQAAEHVPQLLQQGWLPLVGPDEAVQQRPVLHESPGIVGGDLVHGLQVGQVLVHLGVQRPRSFHLLIQILRFSYRGFPEGPVLFRGQLLDTVGDLVAENRPDRILRVPGDGDDAVFDLGVGRAARHPVGKLHLDA